MNTSTTSDTTSVEPTNGSDTVDVATTTIPDSIEVTDPYADDPAFEFHQGGKLSIAARCAVDCAEHLSLAYTPGVGRVSQAVADEPHRVWSLTGRGPPFRW